MPWVYLDDHFDQHPKVVEAGTDAAWMFVAGLCWVNRNLTAGRIPKNAVRLLTDKRPGPLVTRLLTVNLWEEDGDAYRIHDYDRWNKTAKALSEKGRRAAEKRWKEDAPVDAQALPEHVPKQSLSDASRAPDPHSPVPVGKPSSSTHVGSAEDDEISSAVNLIALRRLANRESAKGPVGNRDAWLETCRAGARRDVAALRERQDVDDLDATAIADAVCPVWVAPPAEPDPTEATAAAAAAQRERHENPCPKCDGMAQLETDEGCVPCPACNGDAA